MSDDGDRRAVREPGMPGAEPVVEPGRGGIRRARRADHVRRRPARRRLAPDRLARAQRPHRRRRVDQGPRRAGHRRPVVHAVARRPRDGEAALGIDRPDPGGPTRLRTLERRARLQRGRARGGLHRDPGEHALARRRGAAAGRAPARAAARRGDRAHLGRARRGRRAHRHRRGRAARRRRLRGRRPGLHRVSMDQYAGARLATEHLIGLGHREIRHVAGPADSMDAAERRRGWTDAMRAHGLEVHAPIVGRLARGIR